MKKFNVVFNMTDETMVQCDFAAHKAATLIGFRMAL